MKGRSLHGFGFENDFVFRWTVKTSRYDIGRGERYKVENEGKIIEVLE